MNKFKLQQIGLALCGICLSIIECERPNIKMKLIFDLYLNFHLKEILVHQKR